MTGGGTFGGPVVTARCEDGSIAGVLRAFEVLQPGDVLVVSGGGEWAYFGELTGAEAVRLELAGVVIDGLIRDLERLSSIDLHVFARGRTPIGARPFGRGEVGVTLHIGGTEVRTGDWIIGDDDGLTAVPRRELERVMVEAERISSEEALCWERVRAGARLLDQEYQDGVVLRQAIS